MLLLVPQIIDLDELVKQKQALDIKYLDIKNENDRLKEKNDALQNALVTASKSAGQVSFQEEVCSDEFLETLEQFRIR